MYSCMFCAALAASPWLFPIDEPPSPQWPLPHHCHNLSNSQRTSSVFLVSGYGIRCMRHRTTPSTRGRSSCLQTGSRSHLGPKSTSRSCTSPPPPPHPPLSRACARSYGIQRQSFTRSWNCNTLPPRLPCLVTNLPSSQNSFSHASRRRRDGRRLKV